MTVTPFAHLDSAQPILQPTTALALVPPRLYSDDEIGDFAVFLAAEMRHSEPEAVGHPAAWYGEQIGRERCTPRTEALLRESVIDRCREVASAGQAARAGDAGWDDDGARPGRSLRDRRETFDGLSLLVAMFLLACAFTVAALSDSGDDPELPQPIPVHAVQPVEQAAR